MAKRAKIPVVDLEDDEPVAVAEDVPAKGLPDQPAAPESSPQRSPQCKFLVHFSAYRARLSFLSLLMSCLLVDLCRSGAAAAGASRDCSRQAACPTFPAKEELPGEGERSAKDGYSAKGEYPAKGEHPDKGGHPAKGRRQRPSAGGGHHDAARENSPARNPVEEEARAGNPCAFLLLNSSFWIFA